MKIATMLVAYAMALAGCDLADQATSFMPKLADQAASLERDSAGGSSQAAAPCWAQPASGHGRRCEDEE